MPDRALMETLLDKYVLSGGPLMIVLVPLSLIMVGCALQGALRLRRARVMPRGLLDAARACGDAAQRRQYIAALRTHRSPLARVLWHTFEEFDPGGHRPPRRALERALEGALDRVGEQMSEGLSALATIYTVAPLVGLLGTVHGMILTFYQFAVEQQKSIETLAVGIQYALVTTLWGLAIAIPDYVAAQWLQGKVRRYERELLPEAALQIIDALMGPARPGADELDEPASPRLVAAEALGAPAPRSER